MPLQNHNISSYEADLCGLTSVAAEALYLATLLADLGLPAQGVPRRYCDSSSALQVAGRRGHGRLKHVEIRLLSLQD